MTDNRSIWLQRAARGTLGWGGTALYLDFNCGHMILYICQTHRTVHQKCNGTGPYGTFPWQTAPHVLRLALIYKKRAKEFNQRNEKIQRQRKAIKQDKMISLAIKQSQGLLARSQGLYYRQYSEPQTLSCFADTETPTRWKKLTTWWPDSSCDINCSILHNSENWPQGNGNKPTPELKINCT